MRREESGEGCRRCRIDGVEANSNYREKPSVFVVRIDKDTTNLDVRFCRSGFARIDSICVGLVSEYYANHHKQIIHISLGHLSLTWMS